MISLKESRAIRELAEIFYSFLPGSGNKAWKGHITFKSVADKVGVGDFCQHGSKMPMISSLLERTLEFRRHLFEPLILEIVRSGLSYRQKQEQPISADEIEKVNGLILEVGFKFPDLWDRDFINSLRVCGAERAFQNVEKVKQTERLRETQQSEKSLELASLRQVFIDLHGMVDRRKAGYELEKVLNRLFELHDLKPKEPFRIVGEQIDGSFDLDHEIYLLEAKWEKRQSAISELYVFREKIEGKSKFTRGVFISINGVTLDALEAITKGKQPNFFTMTGYDLMLVLDSKMDLRDFLRRRQRVLAEEGKVAVAFSDLIG